MPFQIFESGNEDRPDIWNKIPSIIGVDKYYEVNT